jgi:acyl-coenzyme A thioesterase PaaI-like protein
MDLQKLLKQAETSGFYKWVLNRGLNHTIPFNRPHRFRVVDISDHHLKVELPYRRSNFNHIRGLHACALATVSEFTTGLLLVKRLDPSKYRLIMQRLEMDYHYQGKMDATATFDLPEDWLSREIFEPLASSDAVVVACEIKIHDTAGNLLTTGKVFWQIKDWRKVKTKVS